MSPGSFSTWATMPVERNVSCTMSGPLSGLLLLLLLLLSRFSHIRLCATHGRQPTRLPHPWDSPSKNTGVGCHFLLQCMKVKSESEVAQSCLTLSTPWTAAHQAPLSTGFSRQGYWSGVPLPSPPAPTSLLLFILGFP